MSEPRYSQPIAPTPRNVGGPVLRVGFGRNGQPAFIFRDEDGTEKQVEATRENEANLHPRGFFRSLARLVFGPTKG